MHFATTATILLRALGIPARYAEGYVLTQQDLGKSRDEEGYLSVLDDKAHAWVEVYSPLQMEWIPVEMTPGYQEAMGLGPDEQTELPPAPDDTQDTVISQQPSSSASSQSQTAEEPSQQPQAAQAAGLSPMAFVPAAVVLAILAIGAAVLVLWRKMALKARQKAMAQKEANALVAYSLRWVLDILRFMGAESHATAGHPANLCRQGKSAARLDRSVSSLGSVGHRAASAVFQSGHPAQPGPKNSGFCKSVVHAGTKPPAGCA